MISETLEAFAEDCPSVSAYEIVNRLGKSGKSALSELALCIGGTKTKLATTRTAFGGSRLWLLCPECSRRCGKLYTHPFGGEVACRICLRLDYRSHRYWRMTY